MSMPFVTKLGTPRLNGLGNVAKMVTKLATKPRLYLREWLKSKKMTPPKLAAAIGKQRQTVNRWLAEPTRLDPAKMASVASALGIAPQELWRHPDRPSLDAMMRDSPDEDLQRAAAMIDAAFLPRRS